MVKKRIPVQECDQKAVSEVVGTLFLLVMTVAFFSIILLWVYSFDSPDSELRVTLYPTMDRINSTSANVSITHRGGETLPQGAAQILLTVQGTNGSSLYSFNYSDGWPEPGDWSIGDTWACVFDDVPEDSRVIIQVVDRSMEKVVLRSELQRGVFDGGKAAPIIGVPVVLPDDLVIADGKDQFFIRAIAADYDNDLPNDGVVADLTPIWPGLGTVVLSNKGFGMYESVWVTCPPTAMPGEYSLTVTATDSMGFSDTNWATINIKSPDESPPMVIITNPTSGEISAGTANRIIAQYTDPNGIDVSSVTMSVWENDIPLDTSSKIVTDSRVVFKPFGGFKRSALYRVNVTVADNNGNVGWAETVFRMSTYSQPGNPQGETSFDVMDRNWTFTTVFWHDDLIRVQIWSEVIERVDYSELRLIRTDSSNVYLFKDRFTPNLTVPPPSMSFPFYVYDATIEIQTGGAYGAPVPPGYYFLQIIAEYAESGLMFDDKITIAIKYEDGSMPNSGNFLTFNVTGIWISDTIDFNWREYLYIEVRAENPIEHDDTTIEMAMITITEVYGDKILYREIPNAQIAYIGPTPDGHVYRMGVPLTGTVDGAQWFYGANWYPLEVVIQTNTWHWQPHPVFGFKKKKATDIAFEAANQIRITRPADIAITDDDIVVYHADGTTLDVNATVNYGEELFINLTIWNLGEVHIQNVELKVWAISSGVTLDFWELDKDNNFFDPNDNERLDAGAPNNYVNIEITWNTSKTGYDQMTLEAAKIVAHIEILAPIIGGYGSPPVPEINYNNNDAEAVLVPVSEGVLSVSNAGFVTPAVVDVGRMYFQVDEVVMTANGAGVRLLGMNITLTGTARDTDFNNVYVFRDLNDNGILDPNDYLVDQGLFVAGVFPVDIAMFVKEGRQMRFFLVVDISGTAVAGRSLGTSIAVTTDVYVDPTATVDGTGFPILSDKAVIMGNVNELTGSISGPASGFPGYPVVYRLDLNAFNTDPLKLLEGTLTITDIDVHVTGSGSVDLVWLLDENRNIITFRLSAPTVTFDNIGYIVPAWWTRPAYIVLNINPGAAPGTNVGITITAADVTLSTAQDSVDPALNLAGSTIINEMADYFEWKAGDPLLDVDNTVVMNMNIGVTDPAVDVYVAGLVVTWTSDMPTYTVRIYIDGVLKFEDDGLNHLGSDIYIPLDSPMRLDDLGKSFRIEFDMQVTKKQPKKKIYNDNNLYFTWVFGDGSFTDGGQYVLIDGYENAYDIYWQPI